MDKLWVNSRTFREVSLQEWAEEVAAAITQLVQEVHALNPGISFEFDLAAIRAPMSEDVEPRS